MTELLNPDERNSSHNNKNKETKKGSPHSSLLTLLYYHKNQFTQTRRVGNNTSKSDKEQSETLKKGINKDGCTCKHVAYFIDNQTMKKIIRKK